MESYHVAVPRRLPFETAVQFSCELASLPLDRNFFFDFDNVGRIEPFALLFLSSELQRCQSKRPNSKFSALRFESCGYAAHMGFFKAFGLDHGNAPGEAKGSNTYIPITIFDSGVIQKQAAENYEAVGHFIEGKAEEMARMLTRNNSGDLLDTLSYSIREITRNVLEHSKSDQFGFCA